MKCLEKKHYQVKILQNLRILSSRNTLVVDFFVNQVSFALKEF